MSSLNKIRFKLGELVATPGAIEALKDTKQSPLIFIQRHQTGDFGDVPESDKELNELAISNEGNIEKQQRVMSSYKTSKDQVVWVITEYDRSVTTILLPSEY